MTGLEFVAAGFIGLAVMLALARLLIGPQAPDRIVAADTLTMITTVALTGFALWFKSSLYLDVALVYSVLSFVGVVALARTIEGRYS